MTSGSGRRLQPKIRQHSLLPPMSLASVGGGPFDLARYRQRKHIVLCFLDARDREGVEYLTRLAGSHEDLDREGAELVAIFVGKEPEDGEMAGMSFPIVVDSDGLSSARVLPAEAGDLVLPSVILADRYLSLYRQWWGKEELPSPEEVINLLFFLGTRCPECGVPDELQQSDPNSALSNDDGYRK